MQIEVARDHLTLQVTATWEEILVAATAAGRGTAPLDERVRRHGEYLLSRLTVEADGQPLARRRHRDAPARDAAPPFTYTFSYPMSPRPRALASTTSPSATHVLREIGLALGGPWEVSYVVTVTDHGRRDARPACSPPPRR